MEFSREFAHLALIELTNEKSKNQEMRQAVQASRRDYEKLRGQLESARRQAIGNDGINNGSHTVGLGDSNGPMISSAPKPFYAGVNILMS